MSKKPEPVYHLEGKTGFPACREARYGCTPYATQWVAGAARMTCGPEFVTCPRCRALLENGGGK